MLAKKKQCDGECSTITFIYKNYKGKKYCKLCWYRLNPPKQIRKVGKKRSKELKEYSEERRLFLAEHPYCSFPGCRQPATEINHKSGRENWRLLDKSEWCGMCHDHHRLITDFTEIGFETDTMTSKHRIKDGEEKTFKKG